MSPLRQISPGEVPLFAPQPVAPRRRWRSPLRFAVATLVIAEAIAACTLMLISHETHRRAAVRDVAVLSAVHSFMTEFTSLDPYHANDYVDQIQEQSTGEFAKQYREMVNQTLLLVAKAEPTTGVVLDAGIERYNDDGSANVLVVTNVSTPTPDDKDTVDIAYRWVATSQREGDQWKISNLVQVI